MNPNYNGRGASWRNARYGDFPASVPDITKKWAGPKSVLRRPASRKSFSGMGDADYSTSADAILGIPINPNPEIIDGVPTFSVEVPGFAWLDESPNPYLTTGPTISPYTVTGPTAPASSSQWWILLLLAGGIYLATRR